MPFFFFFFLGGGGLGLVELEEEVGYKMKCMIAVPLSFDEAVPVVGFVHHVFTCMPGDSGLCCLVISFERLLPPFVKFVFFILSSYLFFTENYFVLGVIFMVSFSFSFCGCIGFLSGGIFV